MAKNSSKDEHIRSGVIETWKRDEGYGFIQPNGGGKDYFFHINEFLNDQAPAVGQHVSFTAGRDSKGRLRAENVKLDRHAGRLKTVSKRPKGALGLPDFEGRRLLSVGLPRLVLFLTPFLISAAAQAWLFLGGYLLASGAGFVMIMLDKRFAQREMWRIPESTLHLVELVGGWPGSGVSQHLFRHKTRKASYQVTFWLIAALHILLAFDGLLFDFELSLALLSLLG